MSQNPFAAPEVQELPPDAFTKIAMPGLRRRRYGILAGGLLLVAFSGQAGWGRDRTLDHSGRIIAAVCIGFLVLTVGINLI